MLLSRFVLVAVVIAVVTENCVADNSKYLYAEEDASFIAPYIGWLLIGIKRVKCGASLISPTVAVTAASCANNDIVKVIFGDTDRKMVEGTEQNFTVTSFEVHADYNSTTKANDIAILNLDTSATITAAVQVLPVIPNDHLVERIQAKKCRTGGFGYVVPTSSDLVRDQSDILLQDMVKSSADQTGAPEGLYFIESRVNATRIPCEGDVGSPIVTKRKRVWSLVGVISGYNMVNGCAGPTQKAAASAALLDGWVGRVRSY